MEYTEMKQLATLAKKQNSLKFQTTIIYFRIIIQSIFSGVMLSGTYGYCDKWQLCDLTYSVPAGLASGYALSLLACFALLEFIKWQEIK